MESFLFECAHACVDMDSFLKGPITYSHPYPMFVKITLNVHRKLFAYEISIFEIKEICLWQSSESIAGDIDVFC